MPNPLSTQYGFVFGNRVGYVIGAVVAVLQMTSCSTVCSAVGYVSAVEVRVTGNTGSTVRLVACVDESCSLAPGETSETGLEPQVLGGERGEWRIDFGLRAPDQVTLSAVDADGAVSAVETFPLDWVRTGGSEECGGPHETDDIELFVP